METYKVLYTVLRLYIFALCKIQRIKPDESYSIACADTMLYVFKMMYHYTKHAKVSIEMAEHVIAIFEDCIYTSMSMNSLQIYISEIKEIIIEKTVGPIFLYKPSILSSTPSTQSVNESSASTSASIKYEFYMESLDIMTTFIRNLFVKFIHLHRMKQCPIQPASSIQGSLFGSVHSHKSVKSVKSESESAINAYTVFDDESGEYTGCVDGAGDCSDQHPDSSDSYGDESGSSGVNPVLVVDVDTIEEHMLSIMIMNHIIVDKWVILSSGKNAEYLLSSMLDSVHYLHDMIPVMNNLKIRLECIYYTASRYPTIADAFAEINGILDEYDEDASEEDTVGSDEWSSEYINSSIAIKEFRPFQLRVYRIYEQKNK